MHTGAVELRGPYPAVWFEGDKPPAQLNAGRLGAA
jgi:hypothetical protein